MPVMLTVRTGPGAGGGRVGAAPWGGLKGPGQLCVFDLPEHPRGSVDTQVSRG